MDAKWFIAGTLVYALSAFGWFYVMKHIKLSSLGVIYAITSVLLLVIVGIVYFHDKLNVYEIMGVVMAFISLILLTKFAS